MVSSEKRKLKIKVDGKPVELEINSKISPLAVLRLVEYKYLFPERAIKYVEKNGEVIHPVKLEFLKDLNGINIVTEPSTNMVKKQMEIAVSALEAILGVLPQIAEDIRNDNDRGKLLLDNVLSSIDWTVKIVEDGSKLMPIYEGIDEAIARIEDTIFKVDELLSEDEKEKTAKVVEEELPEAIREWKEFIKGMVNFLGNAPGAVH